MTALDLKNSILQLAVQGKLVPQDPNDEPALELLKRIRAEKERLVEEGIIKKEKSLTPITEDEIPFDIPESWEWIRLNSVISLLSGSDLTPDKYNDKVRGIPYITGASNIEGENIIINRWTEYPNNVARSGDLLLTCKGTVGKTAILHEREVHIARQIMAITMIIVDPQYIRYFIESRVNALKTKAKSMIPGIERDSILKLALPLPPLAEQERIVAKIKELLPYIEEYDKTEKQLSALNAGFPDKLRKSILQQAVMGKLTKRDPADEPASELLKRIRAEKEKLIKEGKIKKEKPLPPISEDEIPFEIPDTWEWVRLGSIISVRGGKRMPKGTELVTTPTDHIYVRVTDMQNGTIFTNDLHYVPDDIYPKIKDYIINKEDVYLVIVGSTIGKTGLVPDMFDGMNLTENAVRLIPILIDRTYLYTILSTDFVLSQMMSRVKQEGQPKLAIERLRTALIPLPPLAEQKRIVARVEELLKICDELK